MRGAGRTARARRRERLKRGADEPMFRGPLVILIGCVLPALAAAQAPAERDDLALPAVEFVAIDRFEPGASGEQLVEITLRALSGEGEPIADLRASDLKVWQSDDPIAPADLSLSLQTDSSRQQSSVFLLDRSAQVSDAAFSHSVQTAQNFVERAGRGEQVAVAAFADGPELIVPFGTSPRAARKALQALVTVPSALPQVEQAVLFAIELLRADSRSGDGFVVLLSHGGGSDGTAAGTRIAVASAGAEGAARIPVFVIAGPGASVAQVGALRGLAEQSTGAFTQAAPRDFNSIVNRIWRQMGGRYLLRFPAAMDGRPHRVDVEIGGHVASAKSTYPEQSLELPSGLLRGMAALLGIVALAGGVVAYRRWPRPARFVVLNGTQAGTVIALRNGSHRIGSLPDSDVHLASPGVSRNHAEVSVDGERVQIRDLQSKNGTRVNGVLREVSPLLPGDRLEFAEVQMVFEQGPRSKHRKSSKR